MATTHAGEMQTAAVETAGQLTGGVLSPTDQTNLLLLLGSTPNGGFLIMINGVPHTVAGDWSSNSTLGLAAGQITGQLGGTAACTWNAGTGVFSITSNIVGASSTVSFASPPGAGTDLSGLTGFKFTAASGAASTPGASALNPQWMPADGRPYYVLAPDQSQRTPSAPPSKGNRQDYMRRVGWQGRRRGLGPLGWIILMPRDPSNTWFVSTADDNTEANLVNPPTVAKPPPGVA